MPATEETEKIYYCTGPFPMSALLRPADGPGRRYYRIDYPFASPDEHLKLLTENGRLKEELYTVNLLQRSLRGQLDEAEADKVDLRAQVDRYYAENKRLNEQILRQSNTIIEQRVAVDNAQARVKYLQEELVKAKQLDTCSAPVPGCTYLFTPKYVNLTF
jgi:hypothetical protein